MLLETFPDKKIIIDVEWWNYYNRKNVGVDEEKMVVDFNYNKFISEFRLHPRVIFSPSIISTIDKKDIYELPRGYYGPNQNQIPELSESNLMILPRKHVEIKNCIGVHARLGNGEKKGNGETYKRMDISPGLFIKAMRKFKSDFDFYVCSDTKDFIDLCKEEFGDRVKTQDREYSPRGAGPGHLRRMRDARADPVCLIKEALIDILILSKCKHLICNPSSFTALAKNTISDKNIIMIRPNEKN
jgi:hypothetical protein